MFLGDLTQRRKGPSSGVGKENIQPSFFPIDLRVEAVQIPKIGDVPLHSRDIFTDRPDRLFQLSRTPAGDISPGAFRYKTFGRSQTDPAGPARHKGNFSFKSVCAHNSFPSVEFSHLSSSSQFTALTCGSLRAGPVSQVRLPFHFSLWHLAFNLSLNILPQSRGSRR